MVTFTEQEKKVLDDCIRTLHRLDSPFASIVSSRVRDVEQLAEIVDRAPSPNTDLFHKKKGRNKDTLAKKLLKHGLGHVVDLPTKTVLGHGLTVSKLHLFGLLMKLISTGEELGEYKETIEKEYNDLLFKLMAEDLYTSIVSDQKIDARWVTKAAHELITMWDLRTSEYVESFGLALRDLWKARHTLVPVLGTLLGTIEIMKISALLPPIWIDFLVHAAENEEIGFSLEEFLFDLRYEELALLRLKMAEMNVGVIDRNTAYEMVGKSEPTHNELHVALDLYKSFMGRQHTAKMRSYRDEEGPKRSLEEYFVIYLLSLQK
ncbi:MAG: hypothetical protein ACOX0W_04750 [Sphaerochaetaceae bacterium]|jgi:hypothetical protein